jgi:polyisoprenoid-binding protein YceI
MTFRSTRISGEGTEGTLEGDLTIGDVTHPLALSVELGGVVATPEELGSARHAGFEATGQLRRKDFGLGFGPLGDTFLSDVVKIELDLQFTEPTE